MHVILIFLPRDQQLGNLSLYLQALGPSFAYVLLGVFARESLDGIAKSEVLWLQANKE